MHWTLGVKEESLGSHGAGQLWRTIKAEPVDDLFLFSFNQISLNFQKYLSQFGSLYFLSAIKAEPVHDIFSISFYQIFLNLIRNSISFKKHSFQSEYAPVSQII